MPGCCAPYFCPRCGLETTQCCVHDHASVCVARSMRRRDVLSVPLGAWLRLTLVRVARGNEDVADVILKFYAGGPAWTCYPTTCMTCGLRRSPLWPNREFAPRRFVVSRCDLAMHYAEYHAERRCGTCGAATTARTAASHVCKAPWLDDYDVACPAGCGETCRRSFLETHAAVCAVQQRAIPAMAPWLSDRCFRGGADRGPRAWRWFSLAGGR